MNEDKGTQKPRMVGINHVAIEVDDVDAALAFYGRFFDFTLRGRGERAAFVDMGDQFLAIGAPRTGGRDASRHFGLVVDDRAALRETLEAAGVEIVPGGRLDFIDPWGNRVEVIDYRDIQFTKAPEVLAGMGLDGLAKTEDARAELRKKGIEPAA